MISTSGLVKRYGQTTALAGIDLAVPDGAVYGLVGPNGAGKTTLLGVLAGLRRPSAGSISIPAPRSGIGVLPDTPRFDPWLTGEEVVALSQRLMDPNGSPVRVTEVLAEAGLSDSAGRAVGGYSRGMLQRLGVAATLVGRPRLVMLDEPCSALDPGGRRAVLDLIGRLRGEATVLFSSHILSDVQEVCDTVGVLRDGRLLFQGRLQDLLVGNAVPRYVIRVRPPIGRLSRELAAVPWVSTVTEMAADELRISVATLEDAERRLSAVLARSGAAVVSVAPEAATLEQVFLELMR